MKIEKTLIDFIDEALGNLDKGTSMLFVCDSLTLNDAITLCGLITISFVKQGGGCILVTTSLPFSMFFDEIKSRFAEEELPFLKKSLEKGMGYYIDISSEEASKEDLSNSKGIIKINNDPNRIMYEILFSGDQIKKGFPDIPVLISYQNFSSSIIDFGPEPVLKMFRKLTTSAKQKGYVITGLVNRDLHDSHVLNTLMHFADFVVELSSEKKGGVKQPYVQVLKSPNLEQNVTNLQQRYAYTLSGNSFSTIPALAPAFDELKRNISYLDSGALSIHNTKYLIMSLNTFLLLYKELEKNFKINEYSEFVKNFGKTVGLEITKLFKSEHRLGGNELLEEALNYVLLQGWGRLIKKEGSLESGRLKISYFETFARNYGKSDHKVSQIFEGILSGMLESVTGSKWSCRETKCIATGDELCEFEAEVEK